MAEKFEKQLKAAKASKNAKANADKIKDGAAKAQVGQQTDVRVLPGPGEGGPGATKARAPGADGRGALSMHAA